MRTPAIYSSIIECFSPSFSFNFIGSNVSLCKYFHTVHLDERIKYEKQLNSNEHLKRIV